MAILTTEYPTIQRVVEDAMKLQRRYLISIGYDAASAQAATASGSDRYLSSYAYANALGIVFANNRALEDAWMPDTAEGDELKRLCDVHGVVISAGAGASGDVAVVCTGIVTYVAGLECTSDSTGKRYRVVTATAINTFGVVSVIGIDTGENTDLAAAEILTWTAPPAGSASTCTVAGAGLQFGVNADSESTSRAKLAKRLSRPQNGGSWAHYVAWAEAATSSVENAYAYPAAQGPGTAHVAYTTVGKRSNNFARAGTTALTNSIVAYVLGLAPEFADTRVTASTEADLSVAFTLTLANPREEGGVGGGWINKTTSRWPLKLAAAPATVTTVTNSTTFILNSVTTLPLAGTTIVHIFDNVSRKVLSAKVVSYTSTGGGPYNVTIHTDVALPTVVAGAYVFPASERASYYADTFMGEIAKLSPGEKTSNALVLPRAYRHPRTVDGFPSAVTTRPLSHMQDTHGEITNANYFSFAGSSTFTLPIEPAVSAAITDPPNVWRVKNWAIYP